MFKLPEGEQFTLPNSDGSKAFDKPLKPRKVIVNYNNTHARTGIASKIPDTTLNLGGSGPAYTPPPPPQPQPQQ